MFNAVTGDVSIQNLAAFELTCNAQSIQHVKAVYKSYLLSAEII